MLKLIPALATILVYDRNKIFSSHLNVLCKLYFDNDFYKQKIKAGILVHKQNFASTLWLEFAKLNSHSHLASISYEILSLIGCITDYILCPDITSQLFYNLPVLIHYRLFHLSHSLL